MELTRDSTDWALPSKPMLELKYSPTAVAVDPRGNVWVADGYGHSLVHRSPTSPPAASRF